MNANILVDPCLSVETLQGKRETLTLPGLFAAMERNRVAVFPALRPHQAHPWHAFLCQLAALALEGHQLPQAVPGQPETFLGQHSEEEWRTLLRALTAEFPAGEPWTLVVADLDKPAFMQPPIPGPIRREIKPDRIVRSPDDLDILETAKRHGVKASIMTAPTSESWLLALVSLQTHAPYGGSKLQCSSRQNGGCSSRPGVTLLTGATPSCCWARDVRVILDNHELHIEKYTGISFDYEKGSRLLWLEAWSGKQSASMEKLHPLYIETARIVRLRQAGAGKPEAFYIPTDKPRLLAGDLNGNIGDPWIPVELKGPKSPKSFNSKPRYEAACRVLFEGDACRPSLLQNIHALDGNSGLVARFRVLTRGQSKTDGYDERLIPFPRKQPLFSKTPKDQIAALAKSMVELARKTEFALRRALMLLMQPGKAEPDDKQKETKEWAARVTNAMDRAVDERFFPCLWECLALREAGAGAIEAVAPWLTFLKQEALDRFEIAARSLPGSSALRLFAVVKAERLLKHSLGKLDAPADKRKSHERNTRKRP